MQPSRKSKPPPAQLLSASASASTLSNGSAFLSPSRKSDSTTFSTLTDSTQTPGSSLFSSPRGQGTEYATMTNNRASVSSMSSTSCKNCPTSVSSVSTILPHHSASNYDPAVARLNLPPNVIAQLEKLVAKKPKSLAGVNADPDAPTHGMKIRFYTSLFVLVTIGLIGLVANSYGANGLSGFMIGLLSAFAFHWFVIYGSGLSQHRKAYFNEKNVLDTYQIYDREFGHLFQKEPDTPANGSNGGGGCCGPPPNPADPNVEMNPVQNVAKDLLAQYKAEPKEKAQFNQAVQDHYGNMYDNIRRINQEMDLMAKAKQANSEVAERTKSFSSNVNADAATTPNNSLSKPLIPADIPLPGADDDKKNQQK